MNKRRWIAVGVACGLLLLSIIVALIPGKDKEEASNTTLTGINKIFYGSNEITEETLEEGASNKRLSNYPSMELLQIQVKAIFLVGNNITIRIF